MPPDVATRWVGSALGLSLRSEFDLPGLDPAPLADGPAPAGRVLELSLGAADHHADSEWGERAQEWRFPDGRLGLAIDADPEHGYRFFVHDAGVFELAADGRAATCRPTDGPHWRWRRYLTGQVLPFAALLQGLEVFHSSAVEIGGFGIGLTGGSGTGKSTLALNLHLAGAGFITDDVMALEILPSGVVAHPGVAMTKVRRGALHLVDDSRLPSRLIAEDEQELRYALRPAPGPLPLAAVCVLEPSEGAAGLEVEESAADPWQLIGSTFNLLVQDAGRLRRQLDICGEVARRAAFLRVRVPARPDIEAAALLEDRLGEIVSSLSR